MPGLAVGRIPDIVEVVGAVVPLQYPQLIVEDRYFVVVARRPGCLFVVELPVHAVGGAPDIAVVDAIGFGWRVVGAAAENPDTVVEDCAAADHAARCPTRLGRFEPLPFYAIFIINGIV